MKHPRLFWATLLPVAAASFLAVHFLAPELVPTPRTVAHLQKELIPTWAAGCAPEPLEQASYVLAVLLPVLLQFGITIALKHLGAFRREDPRSYWLSSLAVLSQLTVVCLLGYAWVYESEHGWKTRLFDFPYAPLVLLLSASAYCGYRWLHPRHKEILGAAVKSLAKMSSLPWLIAVAWTSANLLKCVFTEGCFDQAPHTVTYHLPYTLGEFAAVLNGRVPLVDFYSQYQNILPHLFRPIFALAGLTITSFTCAMALLSLVGFLLIYRVFSRLTGTDWRGLVLYLPWVPISLSNTERPGTLPANAFNYYAVGPIRYFGVFLLAYVSTWYLAAPRFRRLACAGFVGGLVALNNLDFGVPAWAGLWACIILFPPTDRTVTRFRRTLRASAAFVASGVLAFTAFCSVIRVGSGGWPDLVALVEYQRTFAVLGFYMIKMPSVGLHWVLYSTFATAVLYAVFVGFSEDHQQVRFRSRVSTGLLAYGGIAGFGVMTYYVGRSHPAVLITIFAAWAFVLALLVHRVLTDLHAARLRGGERSRSIHAIPVAAALAVCAGLSPLALDIPHIAQDYERLSREPAVQAASVPSPFVSLISKYVGKNQPTVIIYPYGHLLAVQASVKNLFPFAHPNSVLLVDQSRLVLDQINKLPAGHNYVFAQLVPAVADIMSRTGFEQIDGYGDFTVWRGPSH